MLILGWENLHVTTQSQGPMFQSYPLEQGRGTPGQGTETTPGAGQGGQWVKRQRSGSGLWTLEAEAWLLAHQVLKVQNEQ